MFRTEMYRIFSRKVFLTALAAALFITAYYSFFAVWDEGVIDGKDVYLGRAAVLKDKEIAAQFEGPLTEETVRAIWDKYGAPVNYGGRGSTRAYLEGLAGEGRYDNYCNRFVARLFAERIENEDGELSFVLRENLSEDPFLSGEYVFGYVGEGWTRYGGGDWFLIPLMMSSIVIIIALSPAFSEDYAFRTADIILPSARGRMQLWWVRTGAGCLSATVCFFLCSLILFGIQLIYYGWEGLGLGSTLAGRSLYWMAANLPVWKLVLQEHFAGLFSVIALAFLVLGISARCRQSFSSLICSLCVYLGPVGLWLALDKLIDLGRLPFQKMLMTLRIAAWSMPLSYCSMIMDVPEYWKWRMSSFMAAVAVAALLFGMRGYCRHQVKA